MTSRCAASKTRFETQAGGEDLLLDAESPVFARRTGRLMVSPASGRYELQVFRDRPDPTTRAYFRFGRSSLLPGGLGSGSETEFRDREKGASLQNELCQAMEDRE